MIQSSINQSMSNIGSAIKKFKPMSLTERQDTANKTAKAKFKAKSNQKRRFKDYLGNLPSNVKSDISKQFTPYQRKKIMNEVDANGK